VEVDPAPEVKISAERAGGLPGRSFIPADRVSARAYASFDEATVITVPAEADASRPTVVTVTGDGALDTVTCWCRPSRSPGPWSYSTTGAAPPTPTTSSW
jgi:hypothetical protein